MPGMFSCLFLLLPLLESGQSVTICPIIQRDLPQQTGKSEVADMSQLQKKSWLAAMSPMQRTILGLLIIAVVLVVGVIYGPHYDTDDNTTGYIPTPALTVNGQTGALTVNQSTVYQGVTVTVTSVMQAKTFSDDNKSQYAHTKYVLRVYLHVQAPKDQQGPLGIAFADLSRLVLSDGTQLRSNLVEISPDILPGQDDTGFMDFWVQEPLDLAQLSLTLNGQTIAFRH